MTAKETINAILLQENITAAQLAKDIGLSRPQAVYDIINGKVAKVSARMANLIHSAKPMYSIDWLLTGDGNMLDSEIQTSPISNHRKQESVDALSVINSLITQNSKIDEELCKLRLAIEHLEGDVKRLTDKFCTYNFDDNLS